MSNDSDNYYDILELNNKRCSTEDIYNAYKRMAMKYHPKYNSQKDFGVNNYKFNKVTEAFVILSNSKLRGVYDVYGKENLKHGFTDKNNNLIGGYKYSGNGFQIFESIFASVCPYSIIKGSDNIIDDVLVINKSDNKYYDPEAPIDINLDLIIDFKLVYKGGTKKFIYDRKILNEDKRTTSIIKDFVLLNITPGIKDNSKFVYKEKGNELPGYKPSSLIVTIKTKDNSNKFIRNGHDLIVNYPIKLHEALNPSSLIVYDLFGKRFDITVDEIINPQSVQVLKGKGLPRINNNTKDIENDILPKSNSKYGDIIIKFDVLFPINLSIESKESLINCLEDSI